MHKVTVCIISHGHKEYIHPCLESLFRHTTDLDFEVDLVLNTPEEGLERLVRSSFPQVNIRHNPHPLGFAQNNNRVYETTKSEYFLLLNPDTVLLNDALARLVSFCDENPEVGACGPKLLYPDGRLQTSCRHFPTLRTVLLRRTPLRILFPHSRIVRDYTLSNWDHGSAREVDWVFGACLLARRSAVETVGFLDDKLFLFCEDIDWCYRFKTAGWKVFYVPDARVQHDLDDARYNRFWSRDRILHYRSMVRYWRKNMLLKQRPS